MHEVSRWDTDQGMGTPRVAPLAGMNRPDGTKTGELLFHQNHRSFGITRPLKELLEEPNSMVRRGLAYSRSAACPLCRKVKSFAAP